MNAAGSLGFAPDPRGQVEFTKFGAFVTNPISTRLRNAANPPNAVRFAGGVLLHTGFPNPGLSRAIKQYAAAWKRSSIPIIVHLLSGKPEDTRKSVIRLEELENVIAVELGFEAQSSADMVGKLVRAATGELPVIAQIPLTRAAELAEVAMEMGASAISLAPPRGSLMAGGKLVSGRLYGPAILPHALEAVKQVSQAGYPVIGAGGVQGDQDDEAMMAAGAMAVQVDIGLWK
jgi:dihydroorotate dehydrogenase (NAD+) catalytic subunit